MEDNPAMKEIAERIKSLERKISDAHDVADNHRWHAGEADALIAQYESLKIGYQIILDAK